MKETLEGCPQNVLRKYELPPGVVIRVLTAGGDFLAAGEEPEARVLFPMAQC